MPLKITVHERFEEDRQLSPLEQVTTDMLSKFEQVTRVDWSMQNGKPHAIVYLYTAMYDSAENLRELFVRLLGGDSKVTGVSRECSNDERSHNLQWCIELSFK